MPRPSLRSAAPIPIWRAMLPYLKGLAKEELLKSLSSSNWERQAAEPIMVAPLIRLELVVARLGDDVGGGRASGGDDAAEAAQLLGAVSSLAAIEEAWHDGRPW